MQVCGDDELCLFDIAATGDVSIGEDTKEIEQELETLTELLTPSQTCVICTHCM